MSEIKQLDSKLEEQFRLTEQLAEARSQHSCNQQVITELKNTIMGQKQENASQESVILSKDAALANKDRDMHHLIKRVNWVTQMKQ